MKSNLRNKFVVIAVVVLICLLGLFSFNKDSEGDTEFSFPTSFEQVRANLAERINLGLDLRGGMHMILQVEVEEAVNSESDQLTERIRTLLTDQGVKYGSIRKQDKTHVLVTGIQSDQRTLARDLLRDNYSGTRGYNVGNLPAEDSGYVLEMTPTYQSELRTTAHRNSIETIRQRVDALGVSEPTIAEHGLGEWEILVQLPGVDDPTRVRNILQSTALLELKLATAGPYTSQADAFSANGGRIPPDSMLLPSVEDGRTSWYVVSRSSVVTGRDLRNARAGVDPQSPGSYAVDFTLSNDGASRFGPFTERNIGNLLSVVLDNRIQSVATIQGRIDDFGQITGRFTQQEALDLALILRSGSLPASLHYLEERTVGPSLGADSIRAGMLAIGAGFLGVVVFMLVYYRLSGVNAVVALVLNLVLLLAVLAYAGATLTLPGIAGVLLTIGMAVDANVLIFERIREEIRAGKGVVSAVENGFERAFTTIFDTNVTTIIAAVFLYGFGAGPIRGFAVTLTVGLLANLFAAVYVSRAIFEYILGRQARPTSLSI
jgi:preprotein translocase subunit SecD